MGVSVDTSYEITNAGITTPVGFLTYNSIGVELIDETVLFTEEALALVVTPETVNLIFPFPSPGVTISEVCYVDIQPSTPFADQTLKKAGTYNVQVVYAEDHLFCDVISDITFTIQ